MENRLFKTVETNLKEQGLFIVPIFGYMRLLLKCGYYILQLPNVPCTICALFSLFSMQLSIFANTM